jgi:hypothetical protein
VRISCPQCGGEVRPADVSGVVRCPYCRSSLLLDLPGIRLHVCGRPRLTARDVLPLLRRWADGRGLPPPVLTAPPRLVFRPFWQFADGRPPRLVPAWPALGERWQSLQPPAGEQVPFDPAAVPDGALLVESTVPETAARLQTGGPVSLQTGVLIHVPFLEARIRAGGGESDVAVEAGEGRVYAEALGAEPAGRSDRSRRLRRLAVSGWVGLFLLATLMPTWWLAAAAVGVGGWGLYRLILTEAGGGAG